MLKVSSTGYLVNFETGDKKATREEALDENGLLNGKYTVLNEKKQSRMIVNYKINTTAKDPSFEVSMYKKDSIPRPEYVLNYDTNRLNRRLLLPPNTMPRVNINSGASPTHNVIAPNAGNWYYRIQK